ncbi:MAG: type II secretion system protein [Phycisphaeraceae bacterium JB051]
MFYCLAHNAKRRHGFTLIELLVVISIISLLISILLPALASARKAAQNTQCMSQFRQIGIAVHAYLNDNKDVFFTRDSSNSYDPLGRQLKIYTNNSKDIHHCVLKGSTSTNYDGIEGKWGYGFNDKLKKKNVIVYVHDTTRRIMFADTVTSACFDWASPSDRRIDYRHIGNSTNTLIVDGHVSNHSDIPNDSVNF